MRILLFMLVLIANVSWAQPEIFGGTDNSLLKPLKSGLEFESTVTGFIGLDYIIPFKNKTELKLGSFLGRKRSVEGTSLKYNNTYVSLFSNYHFALGDKLSFNLGPQYSILIESYTLNGAVKDDLKGYENYLSLNTGFEYRLQKNLNIGIIYEAPLFNSQLASWPSFKIKIGVVIDKNFFAVDRKRKVNTKAAVKITELNKSALIVSLNSYKNKIDTYRKHGNEKMARLIESKRDQKNKELISAFNNYFDFCPVYFFYNSDSKKIKEKDFSNVFLNSDLQKDNTIKFDYDEFLIGQLGYTLTDTSQVYGYGDVYKNGYNSAAGYTKSATIESDLGHYGFNIKNQNFEFIAHPFPSFTSAYFAFIRIKDEKLVKRLNKRLYKFLIEN